MKPKDSRKKEIMKIRAELNEIEIRKTIERINKTESWLFEKINKITKVCQTKKIREKIIRNERGDITTDTTENTEIHRIIRDYYE